MVLLSILESLVLILPFNFRFPLSPYLVLPYNAANLAESLCNKITSVEKIKDKRHYKYFLEYLGDVGDSLNARTIVIENNYISKSYLIDYSNFYSTCFGDYERICKRVHFFATAFSAKRFEAAIVSPSEKNAIWNSYLGYVVIKPLPLLTIGATLLRTYNKTDSHKRHFPATKTYSVNLFGKTLSLNSLAFQEQDSVVGACASSALWSAFHKTSELFQTPLPSPSDITKSAKNSFITSGRIYPNAGLDHYQIGNAIESVGLVSELRNNKKFLDSGTDFIKSFIYAYNCLGLPILMGIQFPDGGHLITITGYKEEEVVSFSRTNDISLKASKIERFYAHDDQIGPFSRLNFDETGKIVTSWKDGSKSKSAQFVSLFIPLHNKIRLTFENVYSKTILIDFYFKQQFPTIAIYWDIHLSFSNEYKCKVSKSSEYKAGHKHLLLTEPLPKYIWLAKGLAKNQCVIEFLFDATQIATSESCIRINVLNDSLKVVLKRQLSEPSAEEYMKRELSDRFWDLLVGATSD